MEASLAATRQTRSGRERKTKPILLLGLAGGAGICRGGSAQRCVPARRASYGAAASGRVRMRLLRPPGFVVPWDLRVRWSTEQQAQEKAAQAGPGRGEEKYSYEEQREVVWVREGVVDKEV